MALEIAKQHEPLRSDRSYSHTPRARALENHTYPASTEESAEIWQYLQENGAATARYVAGINRTGAFPNASIRDPREPFRESETILGTEKLSHFPFSADMHIIGGVTGPYVAGEGDWHGMLLITRGKKPVPTFSQLTSSEMHKLHRNIAETLTFLEGEMPQNTNVIGFSFSPLEHKRTVDIDHPTLGRRTILHPRSPVQNLASIHGHIISMNEINLHPNPTSSPDRFNPRLTREPFLPQLVELVRELVINPTAKEFPNLPMQSFEHKGYAPMYPKGIFISVSKKDFTRHETAEFIKKVHQKYESVYWQIANCVVDITQMKQGKIAMRPAQQARMRLTALLETPQFALLSKNAKRFVRMFAEMQEPNDLISPSMHPEDRAKIMEKFVLLGPAYNQLYYNQGDRVVIGWHPRWITGASPCETIGVHKDQLPTSTDAFEPIMAAHKEVGRRLLDRI
jgi:hypothetical protein